jgi:predicted phage terminase large subunit-like protein
MKAKTKKVTTPKVENQNELVFAPVSKPQEIFLTSNDVYFTLYGGAAGSGKSAAILGAILPICHHPGTRALIIRKTTKQLSGAGSLFDAAIQLFSKVDPKLKIKSRDLTLVFSSGAVVQFTYLDKPADRQNIQGKEYSFIAFDECQQLTFDNVMYALSRLRSTIVDYPLRAIASCNPDYDSFLREWVEFCLDERGIPVRPENHNYPKRYYVNTPSGMKWYDSLEVAQSIHGSGATSGIKSFKFVPATATDNTILLKTNPDYLNTLKSLPRVEMERLLLGSWYAREQAAGYFKRDWCTMVRYPNFNTKRRVRAWDLAATKPSEANPDPDSTAGVLLSRDKVGFVTVEDVRLLQDRPHVVKELIFETARLDGPEVIISLPLDPGATAGAYCRNLQRELVELGYTVKLVRPDRAKLQRFRPFATIAESGFVKVVEAEWNSDFFTELENFDGSKRVHDDMVDCCSDAYYVLCKEIQLPDFELPNDLTTVHPFLC